MTSPEHFLLLTLQFASPADSVYGTARDGVTGVALSGVRVEAVDRSVVTLTNEVGEYSLPGSGLGHGRLQFSRPQYDSITVEVTVPPGHSFRLDVELQPLPMKIASIEVNTIASRDEPGLSGWPADDPAEIGFRRFTRDSIQHDPLAVDRDPLLTLAQSPGTGAQGGFPSTLHIRGGSSDQNLVLLDGVPVYGAMHLGGVASIFNPDVIGSVDLHSAVPPANLSGRLSSVIGVEIRSGSVTRPTLTGAWTPMSLRGMLETPFDRGQGSLLLSGRRSYRGIFAADPGDGEKANRFQDYLFRGSYALGRDNLSVYAVWSTDQLGFAALALPGNSQGQNADTLFNRFHWSNNTEAIVWRHPGSGDRQLTARAWHAEAGAGVDWSGHDVPQRLTSNLNETGVSLELLRNRTMGHRLAGVELRRLDVRYDVSASVIPATTSGFQPMHLASGPTIVGAFVEEGRPIGAHWSVVAGLHANYLARFGVRLEPRLSARYRLTSAVSLSLGYARMYQYVQSLRNEESLVDRVFGADLPVAVGSAGLGPARSDQVSAALESRLGSHTGLRVDGYVRGFRYLPGVAAVTVAPFADRKFPTGPGHAEGLTIELTHHSSRLDLKGVAGWANTVRESGPTEFSPGAQRGSWVAVGAGYQLNEFTMIRFTNSWAAGSPTTLLRDNLDWHLTGATGVGGEVAGSPEAIAGPVNQSRLPSYSRSDLGIERRWGVTIMGAPGVLTTSLTLNNLFNQVNVLGLVAKPGSPSPRTISYPSRSIGFQVGWKF
ncbi:MAG: TonB-dependent receptor [Gemmatimonadota bacterium]